MLVHKPVHYRIRSKLFDAVKIRYRLKGDKKDNICVVTMIQYENFKMLPIVEECHIIQKDMHITEEQIEEMNQTLNDAIKKDIE